MKRLFHIHIPKTAGTSVNTMLKKALGDDFQNHDLTIEHPKPRRRHAAGHRTFCQAESWGMGFEYLAIVRNPIDRLRSNIEHFYNRAHVPKYAKKAKLVSKLIKNDFSNNLPVLKDPRLAIEIDNLLVRFLTNKKAGEFVKREDLDNALKNLDKIKFLFCSDELDSKIEEVFNWLELPAPKVIYKNKSLSSKPIFKECPKSLSNFIRYDSILYDVIKKRG